MTRLEIGPHTREQLLWLYRNWHPGEHVLVTGGTGSGKTHLARELDRIRVDRGGHVVVLVAKLQPDETLRTYYSDFKRWKTWKPNPTIHDNQILLWPKVEGLNKEQAKVVLRNEFRRALNSISKTGRWTVHVDEGLLTTSPSGLNLATDISDMFQLIRSAHGTMVALAQRPAHMPVAIYSNLSHAFVGRASEVTDLKRLADIDGHDGSRALRSIIAGNGKHDFTWIAAGKDKPPERVNLAQ